MRVRKTILKEKIQEIIKDGILECEEIDLTTAKIMDLINPLVLATETKDEYVVERINTYFLELRFQEFKKDLQKRFEKFAPDPDADYKHSWSNADPVKGLAFLVEKYNVDKEAAIKMYFDNPVFLSRQIFHHRGWITLENFEKRKV